MPGFPVHHPLPELAQTHVHSIGDAIQPFHPLSFLFSCLQSFSASGSFAESVLPMRQPKYWRFSFSISPSNEYLRLISFRMDWLDLLALTRGTFVCKVMSLLFNMLSRLVIVFLPRSNLLILWLRSPSAVILEPKKITC